MAQRDWQMVMEVRIQDAAFHIGVGIETVKLSINPSLIGGNHIFPSPCFSPKTHYKWGLLAFLLLESDKSQLYKWRGVWSTQSGEINSLAFLTESSFIGFRRQNKNKFEQKKDTSRESCARAQCAAAKWRIEGYACNKQQEKEEEMGRWHGVFLLRASRLCTINRCTYSQTSVNRTQPF